MLALASVQAAPTFAASGDRSQANPSQLYANNGDTIIVQVGPGPQDSFPLPIPSHGGCFSTLAAHGTVVSPGQVVVAGGDYSQAAFVAQCKVLKTMLPAELWTAPVNIVQTDQGPSNVGGFGGKIETCASLLQAYHSGTLSHPE